MLCIMYQNTIFVVANTKALNPKAAFADAVSVTFMFILVHVCRGVWVCRGVDVRGVGVCVGCVCMFLFVVVCCCRCFFFK